MWGRKVYMKDTLVAIRSFCFACQGRSAARVNACDDVCCPLHRCRLGEKSAPGQVFGEQNSGEQDFEEQNCAKQDFAPENPLRVVRRYCLICCGGERREVRSCAAKDGCALWSYRFGVSPRVYRRVKARFFAPRQFTLPGWPK